MRVLSKCVNIAKLYNVAKAQVAFTDIRKMLQGRSGVHFGILLPARLHISQNNEETEFLDAA